MKKTLMVQIINITIAICFALHIYTGYEYKALTFLFWGYYILAVPLAIVLIVVWSLLWNHLMSAKPPTRNFTLYFNTTIGIIILFEVLYILYDLSNIIAFWIYAFVVAAFNAMVYYIRKQQRRNV